jgi:hypothetical protein
VFDEFDAAYDGPVTPLDGRLFSGGLIAAIREGRAPVAGALIGGALGFGAGRMSAQAAPATVTPRAATAVAPSGAEPSALTKVKGPAMASFLQGEIFGAPTWAVLLGAGVLLWVFRNKLGIA